MRSSPLPNLAEMHVLPWPVVLAAVVGVVALAVWGDHEGPECDSPLTMA